MLKPLHADPSLSPIQRAYVLSIDPMKLTMSQAACMAIMTSLYVFAAYSILTAAVDPDHVRHASFNVAKFFTWVMVLLLALSTLVRIVVFFNLCITTSEADPKKQARHMPSIFADRKQDAFRKLVEARVGVSRKTAYRYVCDWIAAVCLGCIFAGLVMGGFVLLPLLLAAGWISFWLAGVFGRTALTKSIQQLFPEPKSNDNRIDVTRSGVIDNGIDLTRYG